MTDSLSGSDAARAIHDGQADAMPCNCPACTSPFVGGARPHLVVVRKTSAVGKSEDVARDFLREARAC